MVKQADVYMLNGLYQLRNTMKADRHYDPVEELEAKLINELKMISRDLGGQFSLLHCSDPVKTWKKVVIEYDTKEKD
tara:strand:+ start:68 stop:298 length:231 start_codon:yes stop_codon:yes gene_type:complete